jgi:hypothetical protein
MSVIREALVLPGLFLTVALLGGLRVGPEIRFVPPPLIALVLGALTLGALVRAGAWEPGELANARRRPLENASGIVVTLTLAAASVQVFNLLTPERGLLHAMFATAFLVQLLSTIVGTDERRAVLRSLAVLLGSAFVLRFIVLESLYSRSGGTLTRVITALMEGVSLGALQYEANEAVTGYLAFLGLCLYLTALFLLRSGRESGIGAGPRQPAQRHQLHGDLPALGTEREFLERRLILEAGRDPLRLAENLAVEILDLRAHGFRRLARALDVLGLLHAPAGAADGRRRATERAHVDGLSPEKRSNQRRSHRDHRLQLAL